MANKTFVLTDENVNNYGFWLKTDGIDLSQFLKNPVMLWMHSRAWNGTKDEVLPIGNWENVRVENGQLLADANFDISDPFAASIKSKVDNGFLKMASIGFTPIATDDSTEFVKPGQTRATVTKSKLKEASIVDLGANDNALALYDEAGNLYELKDGATNYPVPELNTKISSKMKEVNKLLKLADDASEQSVLEQINLMQTTLNDQKEKIATLTGKVNDYEAAAQNARKADAVNLTDAAIKDGRIDAKAKDSYLKLFDADFDSTKLALESIPKRTGVAGQLDATKQRTDAEYNALDKLSYGEIDKAGKVKQLKAFPELYALKYKEHYGVEPKALA